MLSLSISLHYQNTKTPASKLVFLYFVRIGVVLTATKLTSLLSAAGHASLLLLNTRNMLWRSIPHASKAVCLLCPRTGNAKWLGKPSHFAYLCG